MTAIIIILLVVILVVVINKSNNKKAGQRNAQYAGTRSQARSNSKKAAPPQPIYENTPLPARLGVQSDLPLGPAIARLEQALPDAFMRQLRDRVQRQYPQMTEAEYNWKLLELKRYFLMTAILKEVPMFSSAVDAIWHEMLMFTREYSRFGEAFIGAPIHHGPHTDGQPDPGGRAWFDWVYAQLFVATPYSSRIWQPFFRHPLDRELLEELKLSSESELTAYRFNPAAAQRYPEIRDTISLLIRRAKEQARQAVPGASYTTERPGYESAAYMPYLAGALMFYSASEFTDFDALMEQHLAEEELQRRAQENGSSSSSCGSSYSSDSWNDDDSHDRGGGSDDSGSSSDGNDGGGASSSCSSSSSSSCSSSSCGGGGD